MVFKNFEEMEKTFYSRKKKTAVIAAAQDKSALTAVNQCRKAGLIEAILVGDKRLIEEEIKAFNGDLDDAQIIDAPTLEEAAWSSCRCVKEGSADFIVKGKIDTAVLLKAVVSEEAELRSDRLMSHMAFFKIPNYYKMLIITDGGMVLNPTLEHKKRIIENAVETLRNMGYDKPKVGILAAIEKVNLKQRETVDGAELTKMCQTGQIKNCIIEGPLSYDILMNKSSADKKGYHGRLVGDPDILLVPDMATGNILGKALHYSAGADMAGLIVGAKAPIALTSRGSTEKEKRQSLLLAAACAKEGK